MLRILIIILLLTTIACTPKPIQLAYDCPTIKLPPDPVPVVRNLNSKSRPDEIIKAWVATATQYKGWNQAVRNQIESSH